MADRKSKGSKGKKKGSLTAYVVIYLWSFAVLLVFSIKLGLMTSNRALLTLFVLHAIGYAIGAVYFKKFYKGIFYRDDKEAGSTDGTYDTNETNDTNDTDVAGEGNGSSKPDGE